MSAIIYLFIIHFSDAIIRACLLEISLVVPNKLSRSDKTSKDSRANGGVFR